MIEFKICTIDFDNSDKWIIFKNEIDVIRKKFNLGYNFSPLTIKHLKGGTHHLYCDDNSDQVRKMLTNLLEDYPDYMLEEK